MNDLTAPAKFIFWMATIVLALSFGGPMMKRLTVKMAEAAIEAQANSMSYGKFSRQLWSSGKNSKKPIDKSYPIGYK